MSNVIDKWIKKAEALNKMSCDIGYWSNNRVVEKAAAIEYGTARTDGKAFMRGSVNNNTELCKFAEKAMQEVLNGTMTATEFYDAVADIQKEKILAAIDKKVGGEEELKEGIKTKVKNEKRGE